MAWLTSAPRKLASYILPHGIFMLRQAQHARSQRAADQALLSEFSRNHSLRRRHAGRRCFILCTGPSVKGQDLRRLAGELVISVSSGYLHPDCRTFNPAYHCVPHMTFGAFTEEDAVRWLRDMDEHLGQAEIVLSHEQRKLVEAHRLFARRRVHYLCMVGDVSDPATDSFPDLTACVPRPQSVPIMALMLALYMGCNEIYLLGTDHDHFLNGKYTHFYAKAVTSGTDPSVDEAGRVLSSRYEQFHELVALWRQYRWLKSCSTGTGVKIYNATAGGALDEFDRVDFADLHLAGDSPKMASTV